MPILLLPALISMALIMPAQAQLVVDHELPGKLLRAKRVSPPAGQERAPHMLQTPVPQQPQPEAAAVLQQKYYGFSTTVVGPTLLTPSQPFISTFTVPDGVPENATITNLSWTYHLQGGKGVQVLLCRTGMQDCFDITYLQRGYTSQFNGRRIRQGLQVVYKVTDGKVRSQPASDIQLNVTYATLQY